MPESSGPRWASVSAMRWTSAPNDAPPPRAGAKIPATPHIRTFRVEQRSAARAAPGPSPSCALDVWADQAPLGEGVAGIDDEAGVVEHHAIVEVRMIGDQQHRV